jgi:hypothetical protein
MLPLAHFTAYSTPTSQKNRNSTIFLHVFLGRQWAVNRAPFSKSDASCPGPPERVDAETVANCSCKRQLILTPNVCGKTAKTTPVRE